MRLCERSSQEAGGTDEFNVCTHVDEEREFRHQTAQLLQILRGITFFFNTTKKEEFIE